MKIVTNIKLIKRNAAIGKYSSISALVILGIGLYITFKLPDKFVYSMGCLLLGFLLSQFGIYFGNRWGRSPRPDQIINKNLKGLGREYTAYHYTTPAPHLLLGPAGAWVILPFHQGGKIIFRESQTHGVAQKRGDFVLGKAQLVCPDIQELTTDSQAGKRQRWIVAGQDRQVHRGRQVLQEVQQHFHDRFRMEHVEIVQDQHERIRT